MYPAIYFDDIRTHAFNPGAAQIPEIVTYQIISISVFANVRIK